MLILLFKIIMFIFLFVEYIIFSLKKKQLFILNITKYFKGKKKVRFFFFFFLFFFFFFFGLLFTFIYNIV